MAKKETRADVDTGDYDEFQQLGSDTDTRWFAFVEPCESGTKRIEVSDSWILFTYYPFWKAKMQEIGKDSFVTYENCIKDWMVTHWAFELEGCTRG